MTTTETAPQAQTGTAQPDNQSAQTPRREASAADRTEAYARDALEKLFGQATAPSEPTQAPEPEQPAQTDLSQQDVAEPETPAEPEATVEDEPPSAEPEPTKTVSLETFQKRVDKLTAQKAEAMKKAEALETELSGLRSRMQELEERANVPPATAPSSNPLANLSSEKELADYEAKSKTILRNIEKFERNAMAGAEKAQFIEQLKNAGMFDPETGEADMNRLLDLKFQIEDAVQTHIPERRKFFEQSRHFDEQSVTYFPYLKDRTSDDYKLFEQVAGSIPEVRSKPNWKVIVGTLVAGIKAMQANQTNKQNGTPAKPKPAAPAPRVASAPSMVATTTIDKKAVNSELRDRALRSRNANDIESWIKSQLQ